MKKVNTISAIILFLIAGCIGCKQSDTQNDDFITVDVTAKYPKKELILQDFMDVEYVPLETNEDFVTQGSVQDVGKDVIVVKNYASDGDIFLFDRNGKGLKKIKRQGQGGEEYTFALGITLDDDRAEIFVNDNNARKILVYDLVGNFKRSFKHKEGAMYYFIYNFDRDNLICYDMGSKQPFMVVSKQDGSITKEIPISFEKSISTMVMLKDEAKYLTYVYKPSTDYPIIPCFDNRLLVEPSSDTVYMYSSDHKLRPFIVRTPPIQSMDPEVFLFLSVITDRYCFMETITKEYDFEKQSGFPSTNLMYDNQENAIFRYTVYNETIPAKSKFT